MSCDIRPIRWSDPLFAELLAEASEDGRFMYRLRDHWIDGSDRFDRPGELLLGAFIDGRLVGSAGISHDPYEPQEGLGRVRHVYVLTRCRGRGIAREMMRQLIEHARKHFDVVRLHTSNPAAVRLYESLGFTPASQGRETHRLTL
jgi:ribosomal protein S18 acetylase RimI-like enzyme